MTNKYKKAQCFGFDARDVDLGAESGLLAQGVSACSHSLPEGIGQPP
jgi:hypothetical protein